MPISVPRDSGPPPWEKVLHEDRQAEGQEDEGEESD